MLNPVNNQLTNNGIDLLLSENSLTTGDRGIQYLDFKKFKDGEKITALAYVNDVRSGYSVKETGYFTFYVKDINATSIACRLFDVSNFIDKGFTALFFKNKPVLLKARVQNYFGMWSLVIEDIELWTKDFDYEKIIGKIDVEPEFSSIMSSLKSTFPKEENALQTIKACSSTSVATICDGKKGGPAALFSFVLKELWSSAINDYQNCARVWIYMFIAYLEFEQKRNQFDILTHKEKLDIIYSSSFMYENDSLANVIFNACYSVIGLGSPDNYYSILLTEMINHFKTVYKLGRTFEKLPYGSSVKFNEYEIIKY